MPPAPSTAQRLLLSLFCALVISLQSARADDDEPIVAPDDPNMMNTPTTAYFPISNGFGDANGFGPYARLRTLTGNGVGYLNTYTSLDVFLPFAVGSDRLWFVDGRAFLINNGRVGANLGVGRRWLSANGVVWGASAWGDYDDGSRARFTRGGASLERFGPNADFRLNGYMPFDDTPQLIGTPVSAPFFTGNGIAFNQLNTFATPLTGFDTEMGVPIPAIYGDWGFKTYASYYHFQGSQVPDVNGGRVRIELPILPSLTMNIQVSNDNVYHTNTNVGIIWVPGARRRAGRHPENMYERLGEMVRRQDRIQEYRQNVDTGVDIIATNAVTSSPFNIIHVDSNVAGPGTGTFEDPFSSLATANASAAAMGDIVFVHGGSTFNNTSFTFANTQQRLLGEGVTHTVTTVEYGTVTLPNTNNTMPIFTGTSTVTLAGSSEVSGFEFQSTTTGVIASGVDSPLVDSNFFNQSGGATGVMFSNVTGTAMVTNNTFDMGSAGDALDVNGAVDLTVSGNTISNTVAEGSSIQNVTSSVTYSGNTVTNAGDHGLYVDTVTGTVAVSSNTINGTDVDGVHIGNVTGTASVTGNNISNTGQGGVDGYGIHLDNVSGSSSVSGNTVSATLLEGILVQDSVFSTTDTLTISGNNVSNTGTGSLEGNGIVTDTIGGTVLVTNNTISDTRDDAIIVDTANAATISGNTLTNIGTNPESFRGRGMEVFDIAQDLNISSNTINTVARTAIYVNNVGGNLLMNLNSIDAVTGSAGGATTNMRGIEVNTVTGTTIVSNNTVNDVPEIGIALFEAGPNVTVSGNTTSNTGDYGMQLRVQNVVGTVLYDIDGNDISSSGGTGDGLLISNSSTVNANFTNNVFTLANPFQFQTDATGTISLYQTGNTTTPDTSGNVTFSGSPF